MVQSLWLRQVLLAATNENGLKNFPMRLIKPIKRNKIQDANPEKYWRIYVLVFFIFFGAFCIIGKLSVLQIFRHATYTAMAENQHKKTSALEANRGQMYLQDEKEPYPLAINQQLQMAYAVPREMKDRNDAAAKLASILSLDEKMLQDKLKNPEDMFEILKHKLSDDEAAKIREAKLSGIYLSPENFRYYPGGELAAQIVGFVGSNGDEMRGMYGMEAAWEKELKGEKGLLSQEGDARGRWISVADRDIKDAKNGTDIYLTINHTVQYEVEKILKDSLEQFAADSGTIVVSDPKTGKILAMANQPSFNPNDYSKVEDISAFANPAVSMPYESGSVFKAFTVAIGIDTGKVNPNSTYTDTGMVREAGFEIQNSDLKANGVQTVTEILEKSLNTGVIWIEKLVGNATFADYVRRFGFGSKTEIELPGEGRGNIANLASLKRDINFFTISFGQGITVTPIQLAMAYGALANGGMLMKPHIIDKLVYTDGTEQQIEPEEIRQVVSANTSKLMGEILRSVVVNGHGKRGDVPGYLIGGKTGTAQIAKSGGGGYEEGVNIGSFAGYGPINDPRFVIVVKLVNPKNVEWAESSAAPTFGRVMKFLVDYYKVKPTEDPKTSPLTKMAPLASNVDADAGSAEATDNQQKISEQEKDKKKKD